MKFNVFSGLPEYDRHEQVVECIDEPSGLHTIIAVHNTSRGPALGGCRMWPYVDREEAAKDALRLSRGMTYKSALADLNLGGGKAVIIGDPSKDKSEALLKMMGRFINTLQGLYITAEDSGTSVEDMVTMSTETEWVAGIQNDAIHGGDPSPSTAYGTFVGMRAAVRRKLGRSDFSGLRVAIQGVGNVGFHLAKLLSEQGAELVVADINAANIERLRTVSDANVVSIDQIYDQDVDVFSPCAMGSAISELTVNRIKAKVIAGAANNQLATPVQGDQLHQKGVLYVPDYVLNAGGIVDIVYQRAGGDEVQVRAHIDGIVNTLDEIFRRSEAEGHPTYKVADQLAEERFFWNSTPASMVA